jgi:hypothetical protein
MPLPKAHAGTVAHAFLWTCGPWPKERQGDREWYQRVHDLVGKHFAVNLKRGQTTVAFETGQDGYNHCHVVVGHSKPTKFNMGFCKALKALCVEEEDRKINCAANVTPRGDKQAAKVGSYECMRRYLADPTKDKTIDTDGVQFTPRPTPQPPPCPPPGHPQRFYWKLTYEFLPELAARARGERPGNVKQWAAAKRQRTK